MRSPGLKSTLRPVSARPQIPVWLLAALLALLTVALYWPATRCDFVDFDDDFYITENPHVRVGLTWETVKWAFCDTKQAAYWAPMMWLSHQLICQLFGLNPWAHHLINVLLHAANTVLVFLLFQRLMSLRPGENSWAPAPQAGATWRSFFVAALFGWHPAHVESVAWVTERKDVLSTFFGLLALIFYVRFVRQKEARSKQQGTSVSLILTPYFLSLFFFALGLMSKAMLVTLPFVMLLLDWWPLKRIPISDTDSGRVLAIHRSFRFPIFRLVVEKLPFFGLAAVMSIVTFLVQKRWGIVVTIENMPFAARGNNALISYCRYLGKLFWPTDLAVFYPHPGNWPEDEVALAGGLLLGITVLCIVVRRQYPFMLMGWLWFVGTLVPVIQLVQSGRYAMADRYTYIPSLGVSIMLVWGVCELTRRWRRQIVGLSVAGCAVMVLCLGMTRKQLGYWQNSETLFRHTLAVTRNNQLAHNNLGLAVERKGQTDEAIRQFQGAIRLDPGVAEAHNNLGTALGDKSQMDEAIHQFREAIRLNPGLAEAHYNLGTALGMKGRTDEAIRQFQEAIRLQPDFAEARSNLAHALELNKVPPAH